MIRLTITPAAFEAIAATLPGSVRFENKRRTATILFGLNRR
jgi:hypothetical protein